MATEKLGRVADAALSDERAQPLFDQAAEHFKDSTSNCLVQWASVMITKVDRWQKEICRADHSFSLLSRNSDKTFCNNRDTECGIDAH